MPDQQKIHAAGKQLLTLINDKFSSDPRMEQARRCYRTA